MKPSTLIMGLHCSYRYEQSKRHIVRYFNVIMIVPKEYCRLLEKRCHH